VRNPVTTFRITLNGETKSIQDEKCTLLKQIKDLEAKLSNARDLVAGGKIDSDDLEN
jgi:hypothetical protein